MVNTLPGKIAAIILVVFVIQLIAFIVAVFSSNGFGAMVNFIQFCPFYGSDGSVIRRPRREKGKGCRKDDFGYYFTDRLNLCRDFTDYFIWLFFWGIKLF
ncbi:hypothetical protein A6P54_21250 [Bacillus sp. MKU004]|nr:hypothetical protein A6P54_21250 [Bacillus sp. MKU004]